MRSALCCLAALFIVVCFGCGSSHPRIHIADTNMYASANPIHPGVPVTLWHELTADQKVLLRQAMSNRFGPGFISVEDPAHPELPKVNISTREVSSARIVRTVSAKQGDTVLYTADDEVTAENLEQLCKASVSFDSSATSKLTNKDVTRANESVTFRVSYYRHCQFDDPSGKGNFKTNELLLTESVGLRVE